jgi:hypothetical protein
LQDQGGVHQGDVGVALLETGTGDNYPEEGRLQFPTQGVVAMPWIDIFILIAAICIILKTLQGIRDVVSWYIEGRSSAKEQKRLKEGRRPEGLHGVGKMPVFKERPESKASSVLRKRRTHDLGE